MSITILIIIMSTSDYNKIVSTINSASRDYTYSPDPNDLICIDTSNNRIGINTLDPTYSLHINSGNILVKDICCDYIIAKNYNYINLGSFNDFLEDSISVSSANANNVNSSIVNVSNTLDNSNGRIKANYIDISGMLDISNGRIISKNISTITLDISSTLDISKGNIISTKISSINIDISSTLDISMGRISSNHINSVTLDISSILDISKGHIKAKTIDVSVINVYALLDISQGRIKAQSLDASIINVTSLLDISRGRIKAQTLDASFINISSLLDISQVHIKANTLDASSNTLTTLLDISQGRIKAKTLDVSAITISSLLDISQGTIKANSIDASTINVTYLLTSTNGSITVNNIDVSSINVTSSLDISRGTIVANTISGSAIAINANASTSNIVNININNINVTGINISTNLNSNAITINNAKVATTKHIEDAFPIGVIVTYNSTTIPNGWSLCDGGGSPPRPDLRSRFILGGGLRTGNGGIITTDNTYVYHKFLNIGSHTFTPIVSGNVDLLIVGGGSSGGGGGGGKGGDVIIRTGYSVSTGINYSIVVGNGGSWLGYVKGPGQNSSFNLLTASGGTTNFLGIGQSGTESSILGQSYYWGGAGGYSGSGTAAQTIGGLGGGGGSARSDIHGGQIGGVGLNNGGTGGDNGGNGGANTGGGGGGGFYGLPGSGGSGIVVVRYPISNITNISVDGLTNRAINVSGGEETVKLDIYTMPRHKHSNAARATVGGLVKYDDTFDKVPVTDAISSTPRSTDGVKNRTAGEPTGHENMPPFYVLVYIIKTSYDFCYNLLNVPSAPLIYI